jgi:DNA-binding Lrp family transcriptional regulator
MNRGDNTDLDSLDIQIMEQLELNARQSYKDIAARLKVSRPTVMSRVQRLLDSGVISTLCVVDPITLGYKYIVQLGINTEPDQVNSVAERLASYTPVINVYLCTGRFDIGAAALFQEWKDMSSFLLNELGSTPGIVHVEKMIILHEVKATFNLLTEKKEKFNLVYRGKTPVNLDDVDMKLIKELHVDARQKPGHLARKLGVSKPTIFRRFQRLTDDHIIQIMTAINPSALGYEVIASIGLKCDPDKVKEIADTVASYRQVAYVALCAGRYDVLIWVMFRKLSDLKNFIVVELGKIPGLKDLETTINYQSVKAPLSGIITDLIAGKVGKEWTNGHAS